MAKNLTAEEVRAKHLEAMPEPLGELYHELHNQTVWLHIKWNDFKKLFATDQETVDLLNEAAPAFAHNLQRMMWEDVLLHLCRITDRRRGTLKIQRLVAYISDPELKKWVKEKAGEAVKRAEFARDWRHRRIAHQEAPPLDGQPIKPLAKATRELVEAALASIGDTLNLIQAHFFDGGSVLYEMSIEPLGGVESLLSCLKKGVGVQREEMENMKAIVEGRER